ncbi:MAG: hypothetical protein A3F13_07920 [Gammaproteobacteria bacterium RIFCSPHIGHO2_12_FULL_40_19]|nr:MAG: hypothetical protein A3F13_07920 [Gammaproteobacteria bacterium RIFCSPHIGHO2_12_FULL_40_19]
MHEIGAFDAKTHLSQLLDRASHGESFAITKHGRVIAFLTPASNKPKLAIHDIIVGIMSLRKKIAKRGVSMTVQEVDDLKKSGRR